MNWRKRILWTAAAGLPALAMLALPSTPVGMSAHGADNPPGVVKPIADIAKGAVIERSSQKLIANNTSAVPASQENNPTVEPGSVHWHPGFTAACEAAKKSGKPVLLFQMMGRLDQQFC
jgi:hypothetical protein